MSKIFKICLVIVILIIIFFIKIVPYNTYGWGHTPTGTKRVTPAKYIQIFLNDVFYPVIDL